MFGDRPTPALRHRSGDAATSVRGDARKSRVSARAVRFALGRWRQIGVSKWIVGAVCWSAGTWRRRRRRTEVMAGRVTAQIIIEEKARRR